MTLSPTNPNGRDLLSAPDRASGATVLPAPEVVYSPWGKMPLSKDRHPQPIRARRFFFDLNQLVTLTSRVLIK